MRRFLFYIVWLTVVMTGHAQSYLQRTDVPSVFIETENRRAITSKEQYVNSTLIYVDGGTTTRYEK